jgi:hypothetical protein
MQPAIEAKDVQHSPDTVSSAEETAYQRVQETAQASFVEQLLVKDSRQGQQQGVLQQFSGSRDSNNDNDIYTQHFLAVWNQYLAHCHQWFLQPDSKEPLRLKHFFQAAGVVTPMCKVPPASINVRSGVRQEPPPGHWKSALLSAGLSSEQMEEIIMVKRVALEQLATLTSQRKAVLAEVQELEAGDVATKSIAALEISQQLAGNVTNHMHLIHSMYRTVFGGTMSAQQLARFCLASYPWTPDLLAVVCEMETMKGCF